MIDYFALALGHGLLAIALLRLVLREGLDEDPLITEITAKTRDNRQAGSMSGRNAARRSRQQTAPAPAPAAGDAAAEDPAPHA